MSATNTLRPQGSASMVASHSMIKTLELLQKAIAYGHVEKARELVSELAKQKASISVTEQTEKPITAFEEEIRVKVHIEDKDLSGSHIFMKMKPSMTIRHLKQIMQEKHRFPFQIQKWIVGKRLVQNNETLHKLRIKDGSSMFLYLLSPNSVGLTKAEFNQSSRDTRYMSMTDVQVPRQSSSGESSSGPTPSPLVAKVNPLSVETQRFTEYASSEMGRPTEETTYTELTSSSMLQSQPPPLPPLRENEPVITADQIGWKCTQCTYMNEPTRPGCEMCAANRPTEYQIPTEYQLTEREKRRLEQEKRSETLTKQSENHDQAERLDTYYGMGDFGLAGEDEWDFDETNQVTEDRGERLCMEEMDKSLAMALQKEEAVDFERRHREMQKGVGRVGDGEDGGTVDMPALAREAFPMQETGPQGKESGSFYTNSFG